MGDRNVFKVATIVAVFVILFLAQRAFGYDTFGDESYWGEVLR